MPNAGRAIVRRPARSLVDACELTHIAREPIDFAGIVAEHAAYCASLQAIGLDVEILDAADDHPDSVFVEDGVVSLGDLAVLTRPGVSSRRGEPELLLGVLMRLGIESRRIEAPGTLDGGDVLAVGSTLYVGWSSRTNAEGIAQLAALAKPLGYRTTAVEVQACLHLKTACTALDRETLLINPAWVDGDAFAQMRQIAIAASEPFAANVLRAGGSIIANAANPATWERIEQHCAANGIPLHAIALHEFGKAEAGLTCLSVIFPPCA